MEKPSIGTSDKLVIKRANFKYQKRLTFKIGTASDIFPHSSYLIKLLAMVV